MILAINVSSPPASRCRQHPQSHAFFGAMRCPSSARQPSAWVLVVASETLRNIVVTPGRVLRISSFIMLVLLCPLFSVVVPGVGELIGQMAFAFLNVVDEGSKAGAALGTGGY